MVGCAAPFSNSRPRVNPVIYLHLTGSGWPRWNLRDLLNLSWDVSRPSDIFGNRIFPNKPGRQLSDHGTYEPFRTSCKQLLGPPWHPPLAHRTEPFGGPGAPIVGAGSPIDRRPTRRGDAASIFDGMASLQPRSRWLQPRRSAEPGRPRRLPREIEG